MNRFDDFKERNNSKLCELFHITKEVLDSVEGVMFHYGDRVVELRDKNYCTVARLHADFPLTEEFNYVAFEHDVLGIKAFHRYLKNMGSCEEKLEWMEVWKNGLVKTSYHLYMDFSTPPENITKY